MNYIAIEALRETYRAKDLTERTLTVGELIEELSQFDDDTPIVISNDDGYTYGRVSYTSIKECETETEEEG